MAETRLLDALMPPSRGSGRCCSGERGGGVPAGQHLEARDSGVPQEVPMPAQGRAGLLSQYRQLGWAGEALAPEAQRCGWGRAPGQEAPRARLLPSPQLPDTAGHTAGAQEVPRRADDLRSDATGRPVLSRKGASSQVRAEPSVPTHPPPGTQLSGEVTRPRAHGHPAAEPGRLQDAA